MRLWRASAPPRPLSHAGRTRQATLPASGIIPSVAYEWIGGAVAVSGVLVAGAGVAFTWLTGKQGRDQVERMAQERHEHERTMAREAREQERLASAYVRLLGMAERIGQWAHMVKPMLDTIPPRAVRPLPELDAQAEVEAEVRAYGSDEVREAFEAWRKIIRDMIAAVALIDLQQVARERNESSGIGVAKPYMTLHELRPVEAEKREALARQVNKELRAVAQGRG